MGILLVSLVVAGAFAALVSAISAVRAGLRMRRARLAFGHRLSSDIEHLARRAAEIEAGLAALDARAQDLPVHMAGIQQDLDTLRVLASALGSSLRQTRKTLFFAAPEDDATRP